MRQKIEHNESPLVQFLLLKCLSTCNPRYFLHAVDMHEENDCITQGLRDYLQQELTQDITLDYFFIVELLD